MILPSSIIFVMISFAGEFLMVSNKWSANDQLLLKLPLELRIEKLKGMQILTLYMGIQMNTPAYYVIFYRR